MENGDAAESQHFPRKPRYEGEDVSATTALEVRGFYTYSLAAEVFAVCGVGSFIPVTLEQLARERGVLWSDKSISCMAEAAVNKANETAGSLVLRTADDNKNQCIIEVFGTEMTTSSFAMYTFSIAVFVQALALISFSSFADYGTYRKKLLLAFGFTGAVSSMCFILVFPSVYLIGSILTIIGVTCLGSSFVLLNSYLPLLVANHPIVRGQAGERPCSVSLDSLSPNVNDEQSSNNETIPESATSRSSKTDSQELKISAEISSRGVGVGYTAAVTVQILSIILLKISSKESLSPTMPLRLVLLVVGAWWLLFTIPSGIWLRNRPGPPLKASIAGRGALKSCWAYVSFAWTSVWRTIRIAIKLKQVVIFLIAWFLLSDAVATISGTAILFARTELKMGTVAVALVSITATSSGIAGAFTWPIISRRYALRTNRTIVACIALMEVIPLYGLLAYIPFIRNWGVIGLQQSWEIYPLAFIHGFVMGGLSSYCRSFFGLLIPPGSEAAFYALYAITDKGSSAFGPALVGLIVDATGTIRPAFGFLAVLIALPAPLIWVVNTEKGQKDAARMAEVLLKEGNEFDGFGERTRFSRHEAEGLMRDHD